MKKQIMRALLGITILAAMTATAAAQAGRLVVHIPFDFVVGQRQMPAGDYTVRRVVKDSDSVLLIQSADGRAVTTVMTNATGDEPARAELSFNRSGDAYTLASVSIPGTLSVRELPRPKREGRTREMIEQAKADSAAETVTVTASLR